MNCPYCGNTMELGYLYNPRCAIVWNPEGYEPTIAYRLFDKYSKKKNQHKLGESDFWEGGTAQAYFCPVCKVVIVTDVD